MDVKMTIIYALAAALLCRSCNPLFGMFNQLNVPYLLSWILGMILGDWKVGLIVGAAVTTLNMAPVVIGAVSTMNLWDAAVLCVALVLGNNMSIEVAFAVAAPMAVLGNALSNIMMIVLYDGISDQMTLRAVKSGNIKGAILAPSMLKWTIAFVWNFTWYFILVYFGTRAADVIINAMPGWIISGFVAGGKLLPAVGFGLFLAAMGKKKFIPFFIIGAYCKLYIGLSSIQIAVMSVCIAFIFVLLEKSESSAMLERRN